mmetsp:Transcript_21926/g.74348  ORF Transcript_21926/g.74348 Transcript_21926/m.74348 type:complete len:295 (+) Transcript_21926:1111-1995(+)
MRGSVKRRPPRATLPRFRTCRRGRGAGPSLSSPRIGSDTLASAPTAGWPGRPANACPGPVPLKGAPKALKPRRVLKRGGSFHLQLHWIKQRPRIAASRGRRSMPAVIKRRRRPSRRAPGGWKKRWPNFQWPKRRSALRLGPRRERNSPFGARPPLSANATASRASLRTKPKRAPPRAAPRLLVKRLIKAKTAERPRPKAFAACVLRPSPRGLRRRRRHASPARRRATASTPRGRARHRSGPWSLYFPPLKPSCTVPRRPRAALPQSPSSPPRSKAPKRPRARAAGGSPGAWPGL